MMKLLSLSLISRNPSRIISLFSQCSRYFNHHCFSTPPNPLKQQQVQTSNFLLKNQPFSSRNALLNLKVSSFTDNGKLGFRHNNFRSPCWQLHFRRSLTTSAVLGGLVLTNAAVFLVLCPIVIAVWKHAGIDFLQKNFTLQLDNFKRGRIHTMITCAFTHAYPLHIIANMIPLCYFGNHIGQSFGPEFLLKLYLAGAFAGSAFFLGHQAYLTCLPKHRRLLERDPSKVSMVGASAAVNAIMLLDLFYFPAGTVFHIKHVPGILWGILTIVGDVIIIIQGNREIAGSAHMGGTAVAAIALVWARLRTEELELLDTLN